MKNIFKRKNLEELKASIELKALRTQIKSDKKTKKTGVAIYFLLLLGLITTTLLSIAGGFNAFVGLPLVAFVISMIFVQLVIFAVSSITTIIKERYPQHLLSIKILQICLLIISIRFNYIFFIGKGSFNLFVFLLCVCIDLAIIKFVPLSYDLRHNIVTQDHKVMKNPSLLYMVFYNLIHRFRINQQVLYNKNSLEFLRTLDQKPIDDLSTKLSTKPNENLEQNNNDFDSKLETKSSTNLRLNESTETPLQQEQSNNVLNERVVNLVPNLSTNQVKNTHKTSTKKTTKTYSKIKKFLAENYSKNSRIISKKLKEKFNLSISEYRKIISNLKADNLVYTENKYTYYKGGADSV